MIINHRVYEVGFWAGTAAAAATLAFVVLQVLQLYGVLVYPADEISIYASSFCIVLPFIVEMVALHQITPYQQKFWSQLGLVFTIMYAVFVSANYAVQLATVIPQTMKGNLNEVRILQQLPHSLFWDFDALGYIFMGLTSFAVIPLFRFDGLEKWAKIAAIAHAAVTPLIGIVYFYPNYSYNLLLLGFPWAFTAPAFMLMVALVIKRRYIA